MNKLHAIIRISAELYTKFHKEMNLSLDDFEKICKFIFNEHSDLISYNHEKDAEIFFNKK